MEIQIGQDIRKFKTKDIGNFSFKEAGFLVAGIATAYIVNKLTGSLDVSILPAGIVIAFGFFKPYGMNLWTFLGTVGREKLSIQCYINETDFEYDYDEFKELYGDDVVIPTETDVIQTSKPVKISKADKARIIR